MFGRKVYACEFMFFLGIAALLFFGVSGCSKPERRNEKMEGSWTLVQSVHSGEKRNKSGLSMAIKNGKLSYDGEVAGSISSSGGHYRIRTDKGDFLGRFCVNGDYLTTIGNPKSEAEGGISPTGWESNKSNGYRWGLWLRVEQAEDEEDDDQGSPAGLSG